MSGLKARYRFYFGGSFNPPHIGHLEIVSHLIRREDCRHLHLVPTGKNPFKETHNQFNFIEEFVLDLQATVSKDTFSKLIVEELELRSQESSYTYNTFQHLKSAYPSKNDQWVLVVGSDCLSSLSKWYRIEDLLKSVDQFWVYHREGMSFSLEKLDPSLREMCLFKEMKHKISKVSSTEIRAALESGNAGLPFLKKHLPSRVFSSLQSMLS